MRHLIIEKLVYPRRLIQSRLNLEKCPFQGHFVRDETFCQKCSEKYECSWLYSYDEFVALEQKPDVDLIAALEFAIEYVDGVYACVEHNSIDCTCDTCTWMSSARKLVSSVELVDGLILSSYKQRPLLT